MQKIKNWQTYKRSRNTHSGYLTIHEEQFLILECRSGDLKRRDLAMEEIININKSIVHNIAKNYRWSNIPYEDIFQYGIEGLICSVDNFDFSKGNKFSTYAHHYVLGRIRRALEKYNNLIRKPAYISIAGLKLLDIDEEISDEELEKYKNDRYSLSQLRNAVNAKKQKIVGEEELDFEILQVQEYDEILNKSLVEQVLKVLKEKEILCIKMRFGLDGYNPHTFVEIDKILKCDSEQVVRVAIGKIRASCNFDDLKEIFRWTGT